jgi:hypothetical protein
MIFNRALPLLSAKTRSLICYTGVGPQKAIQNSWGLSSVENYANERDFVSVLGNNVNPFRFFDLPQMIHGQVIDQTQSPTPSIFEHPYQTHYKEFIEGLPNRCQPRPVE